MSTISTKSKSNSTSANLSETKVEAQLYGQTKRSSEFSSENHKLEIGNLPSHSKYHLIKHLLERHFKLIPHKIKVGDKKAYVAFTSGKERDEAIAKIANQEWKGKILTAKPAAPRNDPLVQTKRKRFADANNFDEGPEEESDSINDDDINSQVCPLWSKNYAEQLKIKESSLRSVLNISKQIAKLSPNLQRDAPELYEWIQRNNKICCQFDGIEPSPCQIGYRNKCEFNVGNDGTVGFRLGRYKKGSKRVLQPPPSCPIVNKNMFPILQTFQTFLKDTENTKLRGFDHVTHYGNVRQLTIRTNERNECLIIVDMHPQDLSEVDLDKEVKSLVSLFKSIEHVTSVFLNISEKNHLTSTDQTLKLAYGQSYLYEYLEINPESPLKFRIGPTSFFQVNTKAAVTLYRSIIDIAQLSSKSLVLDIGCGTGTIGLSLAKRVSYVIGIEIVESAIADARINARENAISNVSFFAGKAEDLINESISILRNKLREQNNDGEIVAIVDPPRTGFNHSFIKSLRSSNIKKIIYVACDPKANTNLLSLCRPTSKAYQGDPFVPTRAKAFDLFPHTKFCELVLVYERLSDKRTA